MKRVLCTLALLMFGGVLTMVAQTSYTQTNFPCFEFGCTGAQFTDGSTLDYSLSGNTVNHNLTGAATLNGVVYDATGAYEYDPINRPSNCVVMRSIYNCVHVQFTFDNGRYSVDEWIQFVGTRTPRQINVDGDLIY